MGDWVDQQLRFIGLGLRETFAIPGNVSPSIQAVLPPGPVTAMYEGRFPADGFGLGGEVGCGKTMALASILRGAITHFAKRSGNGLTLPPRLRGFEWCCWPEEAVWLTSHAPEASDRCDRLATVPVLILDDLGRERIKGGYVNDWAVSLLDSIVSRRNRECLPILWTTNLPLPELVGLYGASFVSRLTQSNPLVWVVDPASPR